MDVGILIEKARQMPYTSIGVGIEKASEKKEALSRQGNEILVVPKDKVQTSTR